MGLPYENMDYNAEQISATNLSQLSDVTLNNLTNAEILRYNSTGQNWENVTPTYLDGSGINDNYLIKIVSGATTQTSFIESSVLNTSTSLKTYIPSAGPLSVLAGSIETEIFNTTKQRMHLTTGGIASNNGITVTSDGKVGIGVVNPEEDLELDGNIQLDTGGVQRGRVIFYDKQNDHEHAEVDGLGDGTNGGSLALYTKVDGGSVTEKLRINNIGRVGIGTTSPNYLLDVNGDIKGDNLFIGANGQTPKIDMLFTDSGLGSVNDTRIEMGKSDDFINSPAFLPLNAYGMNVQANSDALFVGVETYDSGTNWRPLLKWGDDLTDTPFTIQSHVGNHKWEFGTDGRLVVPNVVKGAPGTVCKIHIIPFTDAETVDLNTNPYTDIVSKTFTKTAGTNLFGEVSINYTINGSSTDNWLARLNFFPNPTIIGDSYDIRYEGNVGGGSRSGNINSAAVYTNGTGTANSGSQGIYLQVARNLGDDLIIFRAGFFKVTEIWA